MVFTIKLTKKETQIWPPVNHLNQRLKDGSRVEDTKSTPIKTRTKMLNGFKLQLKSVGFLVLVVDSVDPQELGAISISDS